MLPHERQERIRERIRELGQVKISQLSAELAVSEMTIYRDIQPLLQEGWAHKVYGGIALTRQEEGSSLVADGKCMLCGRSVDSRLAYRLILPDRVETACCSHCGLLRFSQLNRSDIQALCQDFFTNTTINAQMAWYVLNGVVDVGCCRPQLLCFEQERIARGFVKGLGGEVLSFSDAILRVTSAMDGAHGCGCTSQE
ncbi:DNA-binding transcriptional regulator of sugar metabolism, DeoR/GlpR family [Marininema mesophilum]|uniref:DNA-binding transcriptional regulator of sugar metabolism, DeoR/GlpR family n=1 Tax=Marininema mesophilum TaxID=1048340 RepID=A0A1H3BAQ6_9BACL|nr:DeoR family transcriptional regulator [Marininema mesophilum]SDX39027.1 DNA-binding transcriptional regulator of sugar metabolism, DeoR/GlpR family [Marininema mesophilum]